MMIRSEQVKNKLGAFFLRDPIPFNGTIVTVTASGYCSTTEDKLQLVLYDGTTTVSNNVNHLLFVNCTEVSGDSNVTIGRVETDERIAVRGGHYLGIVYTPCRQNKTPCAFLPAVDNHVVQQFVFFEDVQLHNFETRITMNGVGLQISFTIERGETLYMNHK